MDFRTRLLRTLHAIEPVLRTPGVLVIGSEVPNLLEPSAASTLVVSQNVDLGVPVASHAAVKAVLEPVSGMPDPRPHREQIARLLARLEQAGGASR